jgi:hypothetical protein
MQHGVFAAMERKLPLHREPVWDLPDLGPSPIRSEAPIALIRPVLRRTEWDNAARNPLPEYVSMIASDLKQRGFAVIVICDLTMGREWLVDNVMPPHNLAMTNGEMTPRQLLAVMRDAAVVVGGVGWIVPAAVALGTPTFVVLGGNGGMNAPDKVLDPRMPSAHIGFATPKEYCRCLDMHHDCKKAIPDIEAQWSAWRRVHLSPTSLQRSPRNA